MRRLTNVTSMNAPTRTAQAAFCCLLLVSSVGFVACGDTETQTSDAGSRTESEASVPSTGGAATTTETGAANRTPAAAPPTSADPSTTQPRTETVRRNGTVLVPPPAPTRRAVGASDRCVRVPVNTPTGESTRLTPPSVGLRARVTGQRVQAEVTVGNPPAACRPATLVVQADARKDLLPPLFQRVHPDGPGQITVTLNVPDFWKQRPDLIQAFAASKDGHPGPTSRVAPTYD